VAFAETEKFMDTPVKHYSSGMYMRLAFAVAAHLEPEILLVDGVLAVGDATPSSHCDTLTNGEIVVTPCLCYNLEESGHLWLDWLSDDERR
jgi:ABC-type polysaccharide/polyol phosphate transport system ATPase subunit